jgi:hypothetical protein
VRRGLLFIVRLFLGGAALLAALIAYVSMRQAGLYTSFGVIAAVGVPLAGAVILAWSAVRLRPGTQWLVARELAAFGITLLVVELLITQLAPELPSTQLNRARVAAKLGIPFDLRTKSQVVEDLRARGEDALPGISREWPRQSRVRQQMPDGLFPLSHASNASVVECNESGRYLVLHTDEVGFNNPPGLIARGNVAIAAVGASFALGHCVEPQDSLLGRLRSEYPSIANFGMAGSSTLSMLATFREYVEPLKPALVLWIMHPLTADLREEAADPVLSRYLDPEFSQGLLRQQPQIDRMWREVAIPVQYEFDRRSTRLIADREAARFDRVPFLSEVRQRFAFGAGWRKPPPAPDLEPFRQALRLAHATTEAWGGKFVVLLMPLYAEVVMHQMAEPLRHDRLAGLLQREGIEVIDVAAYVLEHRDPRHFYQMRISNHPTPEGYRELVDYVRQELRKRVPAQLELATRAGDSE